jgi:hypothetical protein
LTQKLSKAGHLDEQWNAWIADHLLMREAEAFIPMAAEPGKSKTNHNDEPLQK